MYEGNEMNLTKPQKLIYDMEKYAGETISIICGSMLSFGRKDVSELKKAVNKIYQLNDALRIHIKEIDGQVHQEITAYAEQEVEVLCFTEKAELDVYAENYAKIPFDFYGDLCEIKIVTLPEQYGLLVKLHHMIGDAWTLSLMGTQFHAILNGEDIEAYSYVDYVESENKYLESKRYEKDRNFFLQQFQKCDEVTYLNEKQSNSLKSCRKTFVIEHSETKQIIEYVEKKGISAFMLFTAILATYMNRVKMNVEKFYIGTAVLNRNGIKEKNTMGMFVNTAPMLIELDNKNSFAENLTNIEQTLFSVLRHQKYNYGEVLSAIRKEHGFTEKLYDVMISYQNAAITGGNSETTWYHSGMQSESLQIHIDDRDCEGIFRIHYDYLVDKFSEYEIEKMHEHICNLLFDAIKDDSRKLYELEILSEDEKHKLLFEFNDTAVEYPKDKCVHQLFEEQVEKTPDKVAVVACDRTLTYAELNAEANIIAHSLIQKGIGRGDIVAVILPRYSQLIPTLFGVLKTGAAYMPLAPSYPRERIDYLVSESGSTVLIDEENMNLYISDVNSENPNMEILPSDLFCALHTSGSTGRPKVTALTQQNLLNFLYSNKDFWRDVETVICVTISTFDIFMQDTLLSLSMGKKVILASNEQIYNQTEFEKMFENEENVMFFSTPTKFMSYIKQSKTADFLNRICSLIVGGEVFTDELYDLIIEKIGTETFRNGYGPTETTIGVSYTDIVTPPKNFEIEFFGIYTDLRNQRCALRKPLKIYNVYGPAEAYIVSTEMAIMER